MNSHFEKVWYNAVIQTDLFELIYSFVKLNPRVSKELYHIDDWRTFDFNEFEYSDWQDIALDAIDWLEEKQLPNVCLLSRENDAPNSETWGILYYLVLSFMSRHRGEKDIPQKRIFDMDLEEIKTVCKSCINEFKEFQLRIRIPNDNDI